MKKLYTENGITTATVVAEALEMFPDLNTESALIYYRSVQFSILKNRKLNHKEEQKISEKYALANLITNPFIEKDVRGN